MKNADLSYATTIGQDIHHKNCFACGPENKISLKMSSLFDEEKGEVNFIYKAKKEHEGAPEHIHGGIIAAILDEAQGVLCHHVGYFVMTDLLSLKYHKAVPLYQDLIIRAWKTSKRRRRLYTKAQIILKETGAVLTESSGRWYIMPEKLLKRKFDFKAYRPTADQIDKALAANKLRSKLFQKKKK